MNSPHSKKVTVGLAVVVFVCLVAIFQLYKQLNTLKNPTQAAQDEVVKVVAQVGKLMVLPTDEQPTVASVTDPEKLKGQDFFINAKTGDKVLIYQNNRKAILYSPTLNKILEVSPINLNTGQTVSPAGTTDVSSKK